MSHDVFISYSSKDKPVADAACAFLEARGIRCWMAPRDILPGSTWAAAIPGAIAAAKVMLLIFSANANESDQVQREVDIAASKRLAILPLRIENVLPQAALEYYINDRHWLDALTPPLETHLERLAEAIRLLLDNPRQSHSVPAMTLPARAPAAERSGMGRWLIPGGIALMAIALVALGMALPMLWHNRAPSSPVAEHTGAFAGNNGGRPVAPNAGQPAVYPRQSCATERGADGKPVLFCASSTLRSESDPAGKNNGYGPENLFDNNPATAWCEGAVGPGVGQEITLKFSQAVLLTQLKIVNGYAKSNDTFRSNNSVHTFILTWPSGATESFDLPDGTAPHLVILTHRERANAVKLRIASVNGGSKFPDTCISELEPVFKS